MGADSLGRGGYFVPIIVDSIKTICLVLLYMA